MSTPKGLLTSKDNLPEVSESDLQTVRGLHLVRTRLLATQELASELLKRLPVEDIHNEKSTIAALNSIADVYEGPINQDVKDLIKVHDQYALKYQRPSYLELPDQNARTYLDKLKTSMQFSINNREQMKKEHPQALAVRETGSIEEAMVFLWDAIQKSLDKPQETIDCAQALEKDYRAQFMQNMAIVEEALNDAEAETQVDDMIKTYEKHAKAMLSWTRAVRADLDVIKQLDSTFRLNCEKWCFDTKEGGQQVP